MRARAAAVVVVLALAGAGCNSELGADIPECVDLGGDVDIATSLILEAQAVPSAFYGPCINDLQVGWDLFPIQFESGRSWFWLDSDRVGDRFLEVTLEAACDVGFAPETESGIEDVRLYQSVERTTTDVRFGIVTVADRHAPYADELAFSLRARGYPVVMGIEGDTVGERIQAAARQGLNVLIVDDRDVEEGTVSLRAAGQRDERSGVTFEDLLDRFEARPEEETYRATWYYTFQGGCVTYVFDARGAGAEALPEEIQTALGLFPLELLRESARNAGYDI